MKNYTYYDPYHRQRKLPAARIKQLFFGKKGLFLLSFFFALLIGRCFLWDDICRYVNWNISCMGKLNVETLDQKALFVYLAIHRGELLAFLILIGISKIRSILYRGCCICAGGFFGVLALSFVNSFGAKGVLLFLVSLLPHWLIYAFLFSFLYWIFVERAQSKKNLGIPNKIAMALGIAALFLMGIYLEGFVNPILLDWMKQICKV